MIEDLKARIAAQRVVFFVGTGVSWGAAQTPLAGWQGFLEAGIRICEATLSASLREGWAQRQRAALENGDLDEWLNVAEAISRKLGAPRGGEFRRWLSETVGALEVKRLGVIEALGALGAPLITTNYDDLLENVTRRRPITWRNDNQVTKFVQERRLDYVLHIHGHWEDSESVVLGVRSYEEIKDHEHAQSTLRTILLTHTVVFVGYGEGLADPNFELLRSWAARVLGGSEHRHYRLCRSGDAKALAQLHEGERIFPLVYGDSHDALEPFLRALAPHQPVPRVIGSPALAPSSAEARHSPSQGTHTLVGRDRELADLEALLTGSPDVHLHAAIEGLSGVGRPEFVRQLVARLARDGQGSPLSGGNTLQITGSQVEAANIVVGDQHIHNGQTSAQSLDAVEKLVDNGLLDAATGQLDALERTSWSSMSPTEKYRHRKMQGRVLVRRGQPAAASNRFMEAADFTPGDEKAQVLRVRALMLRDNLKGAHELAEKLVVQYPNLAEAKAVWITSAPDSVRADELLAKPWDGLAPEVASALANRLLSEERPKEALEVLQRTHSPGVGLDYWSTYSVALLKYQEQGAEDGPDLLAEALKALDAAYKLCAGEGLKESKLQILLSIAYVHRLRGNLDEEWRALHIAHEVDPAHQTVRVRMAKVLADRGRTEEAIPMYEALLKNGPEYVPFLLGVALAKRNAGAGADLQRAAELFEQTAKMVEAAEPVLRLDGAEGLIKVFRKMKQWERALAACVDFAIVLGPFRSKELEAGIHIERGDNESAHSVLVEMTASESDMTEEQRRTLGVLLQYVGDSERSFGVLEPIALRNEWNASTAALINAAQATGRDEFTIRLCRQLRTSGIARSSVVDAEAAALAKRGEVAAAISVVEQALASQEDPFLRLRLSTLGIASRRPELIEKDTSRLPKPGDGDPHVSAVAVSVLRAAGAHETAIRYAYDAYRANRSHAEGWRAIINAFMPTFGPTNHVEPDAVSVDAAVLVGDGKASRWIIIEATEPEAEHGELPPDHPLVVAMLGKKVGESVEVPRSSLPPRSYRIEEIRSKYVRAYQRCMEQWEELFPKLPGPLMIEVPENLADNIEEFTRQLMPMLQQRARRVEELDQLYQDKPLTFHMLASGLGVSVFGAMGHLIAETDIALRCTRASPAEIRQLLTMLEGGQTIILEASALSTLLLLEESELLSTSLRGRIAIAQSTLDELKSHLRQVETRGSGYMGCRDGRMTMEEIDDASRAKYTNLVTDLLAKASECEVFQEVEHDRLTHDEWDRLVKIGGAGAVESLHRAMRTGEPVWCDDMVLALMAHERGVGVVWTQLMCHHLLVRSVISAERAQRISAKLVGWRFTSTSTMPSTYLEAARLATWNPEHWPLHQHLRLFEVEPWDERSTVTLAVNVLREWWRHAPSDATANAVMVALLERIAARTNGPVLLEAIDQVLESAFGVDVLSYQRAQAALDAWTRARPFHRGA